MLGADQDCYAGCTDSTQAYHGLMDEVSGLEGIVVQILGLSLTMLTRSTTAHVKHVSWVPEPLRTVCPGSLGFGRSYKISIVLHPWLM